jgi:S1-C subfamily serine protease
MKSTFSALILVCFCVFSGLAQKIYFDNSGKATDSGSAYYFREKINENDYKSSYTSGSQIYFEGKILRADDNDESLNTYTGTCTWYFKNGKRKMERAFNAEGQEHGKSKYFYESGGLWKEIEYTNGTRTEKFYVEYSEEGEKTRIYNDEFDNNFNDWDLYDSDKSTSDIKSGKFMLTCNSEDGTSRFINIPCTSQDYAIEATFDIADLKSGGRAGFVYGFKDWENYRYFAVSATELYVGGYYEGILNEKAAGSYTSAVRTDSPNKLKIITSGEKVYFSVNGEVQMSSALHRLMGKNVGFVLSGKGSSVKIDDFIYKEIGVEGTLSSAINSDDTNVKSTGSGAVVSANGYIITNAHVVENSNKILVEMPGLEGSPTFNAKLVQKDEENDLAIIRIDDPNFKPFTSVNYSFKQGSGGLDVGTSVYTIGYPLALSGMGKEPKFTDGKVSSKTGYNNAVNSFQTSIPVQPGNSGGPIFNNQGQLIGVINAKISNADNVSYAIKLSYIINLIELLDTSVDIPSDTGLSKLPLEEQIKVLDQYVVLIKNK